MNKILNWTFGACFRTLGRFLAIFLILILFLFVGSKLDIELPSWIGLKVNAADIYLQNWADGLPNANRVDLRGCDTTITTNGVVRCSNNGTSLQAVRSYFSTGTGIREYVQNSYAWTVGQNGYSVTTAYTTKANYLYKVDYYYCSSTWINDYTDTYIVSGLHSQKEQDNVYYQDSLAYSSTNPGMYNVNYPDYYNSFTACYKLTSLITPKNDGSYLTFRIKQTQGTISDYYHSFIAFDVTEIGPWFAEIENIIENSGFAKATDVQQVETAVNQVKQEVQELNNSIDETNDTIKDDDTSGAEDSAIGFFNDFTTETFGLTAIITAPLNAINSLINSTCNNLVLPLPFVDKNLTLPCMTSIYSNYFKGFFDLYQIITTGLISYYIIVRIFNLVKDFKNPEHDEIEVMDL